MNTLDCISLKYRGVRFCNYQIAIWFHSLNIAVQRITRAAEDRVFTRPTPLEAVAGALISEPGAATHLNDALWLMERSRRDFPAVYVGSAEWVIPAVETAATSAESNGSGVGLEPAVPTTVNLPAVNSKVWSAGVVDEPTAISKMAGRTVAEAIIVTAVLGPVPEAEGPVTA